MMSLGVLWIFRLVHIISAVFWVGGIFFFASFLFPTVRALGPAAGPVMDHLNRVLQVPRALVIGGVLAILSGLGLYWNDSMGFKSAWMRSPTAMVFGIGAIAAIIALLVGVTINAPTAKKMGAMAGRMSANGGPPTTEQAAEMQRLQHRLGVGLRFITVFLMIAAGAMALARYVS